MLIDGSLDRCDGEIIEGWITLVNHPEIKISLEVLLGAQVIGRLVADQFRADLKEAGIGDGNCAFRFEVPAFIPKSEAQGLVVRLQGAPIYLKPPATAEKQAAAPMQETVSPFGGLWINRYIANRFARKQFSSRRLRSKCDSPMLPSKGRIKWPKVGSAAQWAQQSRDFP
jgi:hypothetical protein